MSIEKKTIEVLRTMENLGGVTRISKLPHGNDLLMLRLLQKGFIRLVKELESGEPVFEVTPKGVTESKRLDN